MTLNKYLIMVLISAFLIAGCSQNALNEIENKNDIISDEMLELENTKDKIEYFTVTKDIPMENRGLLLEVIGSAVYDKIEGEDFIDIPSEGKKYLILYLSIKNTSGKDEYFNYNNIVAKLDREDITDTFLLNNPLKYTTIKTYLINGMITQGYLVWEVPENWEKLEVTYTGWKESLYTEPTIVVTPEDLEEPEEYKEDNRII